MLQDEVIVQSSMPSGINTIIIDAAAVVNMIKPGSEDTFIGYAQKSFLPFIKAQLRHAQRVDVVWDEYIVNSLKATTRSHREPGVRRQVQLLISFRETGDRSCVRMPTNASYFYS